jgi:hypothetical protein
MNRGLKIFLLLILGIFLTGLFTLNFTRNLFDLGVPHDSRQWRPTDFMTFQNDSEISVSLMLEKTKRDGLCSTGGFMMNRALDAPPYFSAWGLHGKIFSFFYRFSDDPVPVFMDKIRGVVAFCFGLLLSGFVLFCLIEFGWMAAAFLTIGVLWSDWMVFAGRNAYLVFFMHFLPMILAWILYPRFQRKSGFNWPGYLAVIGGATLLNALCYFDYISNIVLSTATAPLYYGCRDGLPGRQIIKGMFLTLAVSSVAVVIAILATATQAGIWLGSLTSGFNEVLGAAASRMYGTAQIERAAPDSMPLLAIFNQYLTIPALTLPWLPKAGYYVFLSFFAFLGIGIPAALVAVLDGRRFPAVEAERRKLIGLSLATLWGLGATLSWAFLMKGHMFHHPHINGMIFYLPYMMLLYVLIGKDMAVLATGWFSKYPAPVIPVKATGEKPKRKASH